MGGRDASRGHGLTPCETYWAFMSHRRAGVASCDSRASRLNTESLLVYLRPAAWGCRRSSGTLSRKLRCVERATEWVPPPGLAHCILRAPKIHG